MSNFDLIDDYVTDRLSGEDRVAFEQQVASDPALKAEVELQKRVVEGIRNARAAEIKSMLNKVPVGTPVHIEFSVMRMAAGLAVAGVLAASLYYYFKPEIHMQDASTDLLKKGEQLQNGDSMNTEEDKQVQDSTSVFPAGEDEKVEAKPEVKKERKAVQVKASAVQKPNLQVSDPSTELESGEAKEEQKTEGSRLTNIAPTNVEVEIDSSNKKYDFHYQFASNKLMLYGSFDKSLYELIEINGENAALFLFYKEQYFLLDQKQEKIVALKAIKDAGLIKKLKEYRN